MHDRENGAAASVAKKKWSKPVLKRASLKEETRGSIFMGTDGGGMMTRS